MNNRNWQRACLRLHPKAALKKLEQPFIYQISSDELYEIDEKAVGFAPRVRWRPILSCAVITGYPDNFSRDILYDNFQSPILHSILPDAFM